ncbi:MAG: phosphatidate cytidylyltransferase [Mycobacteriales bacterium]
MSGVPAPASPRHPDSGLTVPVDSAPDLHHPERRPGRHIGRHRASSGTTYISTASPAPSRNMATAIVVGVAMAVLALTPLLVYRPAFLIVIAAAVAVATAELVRAIEHSGAHPPLAPLLVGGVGIVPLVWLTGPQALLIGWVVTVVAVMLWRLPEGPVGYARDVASATLTVSYVPFLAGFVVLLLAPTDGAARVIAMVAVTIASDVGGYVVGSKLGRHRMCPTISPSKTWEGTAGSLLLASLVGVAALIWGFGGLWWQGVIFGVAVSAAAIVGDLAESLVKRDVGVKDMGMLLPGHGGAMDRFDSILVAAPVAYLLLAWYLPVA